MFENLFRQLMQSIGVVFRTMRAFFMRFLISIGARIRSMTSITRHASKIGPKVLDAAASTGKKPTRKEDYIETGNLLIAKSFLITVLLVIVVGTVFMVTVGWPFIVRTFLTKHMWDQDKNIKTYSGRVMLYYDEKKKMPEFKGRLKNGIKVKEGTEYDKNARVTYNGHYEDGVYSGYGEISEEGVVIYRGNFAGGKYDGEGEENDERGLPKYKGTFSNGEYEGMGEAFELGEPVYEGEFSKGLYEGKGTLKERGVLRYKGYFSAGEFEGNGKLYEDGDVVYDGSFSAGVRSGRGVAYKKGHIVYKGDFENDLYNGTGVAYNSDGSLLFKGDFVDGKYSGSGTLTLVNGEVVKGDFDGGSVIGDARCFKDDKLYYEGSLKNYVPDGKGKLYSEGNLIYEGPVKGGTVDGGALLGLGVDDIQAAFQNAGKRTLLEDGFMLTFSKIGATVRFSLATDDDPPMVKEVFIYDPVVSKERNLKYWGTASEYEKIFAEDMDEKTIIRKARIKSDALGIKEVPAKYSTVDYYVPYVGEDSILRFWFDDASDKIVFYQWVENTNGASLADDEEAGDANGSEARVEKVLAKLGFDVDTGADGGGADAGGADAGGADASGADAGGADAGGAVPAAAGGAAPTDAGGAAPAATAGADSAAGGATAAAAAGATTPAAVTASAAASDVPQNPYYGAAPVDDLISKAVPKDRHTVVRKLIAYYKAAEHASANAEQKSTVEESLEKAVSDNAMGEDSYDRIRELKKTERKLKLDTVNAETEMSKIFNDINGLTYGGNAAGADLSSLAVYFDASKVDKEALAKAGLDAALKKSGEQYASDMEKYKKRVQSTIENFQKLAEEKGYHIFDEIYDEDDEEDDDDYQEVTDGSEDTTQWGYSDDAYGYAEEQSDRLLYMIVQSMKSMQDDAAPVPGEIDEQGLYKLMQDELIQLQLAELNIKDAVADYEDAQKHLERIKKKYYVGEAQESDLSDAKVDVVKTVTALNNNIISFAEVAADLNDMTDGYISRTYNWLPECFPDEEAAAAAAAGM
ncbi:Uncharacterized conserved protein [Lachnospiraceae bacterium]|nr:Uncharacterized conserved protein [Lachnospiraceae bacterium]